MVGGGPCGALVVALVVALLLEFASERIGYRCCNRTEVLQQYSTDVLQRVYRCCNKLNALTLQPFAADPLQDAASDEAAGLTQAVG
jgi:hypothetical protein